MTDWNQIHKIKEWLRNYNFKDVPSFGSGWYVCRPLFSFNDWSLKYISSIKIEEPPPNKNPIGWILQYRYTKWNTEWHSSKKVYVNSGAALHAVMQMKRDNGAQDTEYRIKPIYMYEDHEWRDYQIYQIIQK